MRSGTREFELKEWYFVNIWFPTKHYMEEIVKIIRKYDDDIYDSQIRQRVRDRLLGTMKRLGILKRPYYMGKTFEPDLIQELNSTLGYTPEQMRKNFGATFEELFENGSTSK